ncbi:hypothetical protein C8F01DRAFT_1192058 [Mycena amicta]|nr:hypothetical protein C8F01DRAFT_1192058 [Mycena amicta]
MTGYTANPRSFTFSTRTPTAIQMYSDLTQTYKADANNMNPSTTTTPESFAFTTTPLFAEFPMQSTDPPAIAQSVNCVLSVESNWKAPVNGHSQDMFAKMTLEPTSMQHEARICTSPVVQPAKSQVHPVFLARNRPRYTRMGRVWTPRTWTSQSPRRMSRSHGQR